MGLTKDILLQAIEAIPKTPHRCDDVVIVKTKYYLEMRYKKTLAGRKLDVQIDSDYNLTAYGVKVSRALDFTESFFLKSWASGG